MTRVLIAVRGSVEELRAPEVADRVPVAVKHVKHRPLDSLGGFSVVVAVVRVGGRGQET